MSFADGMAAMKLEMPERIPRTEYAASTHWELVQKVTGIDVGPTSSYDEKDKASSAFIKIWNYDTFWNIGVHENAFEGKLTITIINASVL